jgi:NADH-quinone oxidoreductase subunit J
MNLFDSLASASFYAVLVGVFTTAVLTVTVRNLFHAAIFLAFTLIGTALIYFFLRADFLAGIQILLYVGAIMTLVIFAIMLTSKIGDPLVPQSNRQGIPVLMALAAAGIFLISIILKMPWNAVLVAQKTDAAELGKALMGEFVFPFEIVSLVLLAAMIGAIVIARSDE